MSPLRCSKKRSICNTIADETTNAEVSIKKRKFNAAVKAKEVADYMRKIYYDIKDVPGMDAFIRNTSAEYTSHFLTPIKKIGRTCLRPESTPLFQLECGNDLESGPVHKLQKFNSPFLTPPRQSLHKNEKNISNSHHMLETQREKSKLKQSSALFPPREQIKPILSISGFKEKMEKISCSPENNSISDGSSISSAKEKKIISLQDLRLSPFSFPSELKNRLLRKRPTLNARTILAMSKKSNTSKISESLQKLYYIASTATQIQEKEQYNLLLKHASEYPEFYSNTKPGKKNLFEWIYTPVSSNESDSVGKENVLSDKEEPLILKIKPKRKLEPRPGLLKHKYFSPEWFKALEETITYDSAEYLTFVEDKQRQIQAYEEQKAELRKKRAREKFILSIDALETIELEKKLVLPELTLEMNSVIDNAILPRHPEIVIYERKNYKVLQKDVDTLVGSNWLNDEVINTYMMFLTDRSKLPNYPSVFAFNTYFYSKFKSNGYAAVKRWTRKTDIFSYDLNIIPMHLGIHWCLCVFDHRSKKIQYYDSMNSSENCLPIFKAYLMAESLDKKKKELDPDWTVERVKNIPHQLNGSDCGMFTLKYAEYITRNAKINFSQEHMPYFRKKMIYELLTGGIN